jgi:uncharacterized protein DUF4385
MNGRNRTLQFDYSPDYDQIDFRKHPELDRIGKGEQGVLPVEPYKSEILPHWRFKTRNSHIDRPAKSIGCFLHKN